jgi:hypothetical protein
VADVAGFVGGDAEHAQQVFGDLVGGLVVVAVGAVVQELSEAERGSHNDGHRELDVIDAEAACSVSCLDIATGTAHDSPVGGGDREAVAEQDVAQLGLSAVKAPGEPETAREDPRRGRLCLR